MREQRAAGRSECAHDSATPFMQKRVPSGGDPSENTCPRCPPQQEQRTSRAPRSPIQYNGCSVRSTASGSALEKDGHPVPLSYWMTAHEA